MPATTAGLILGAVGVGIGGTSLGLGIFGGRKAKREAEARNRRLQAAAQQTRKTNIAIINMQAVQQREKVTRDTNLLLGQLAVSAAERGVASAQSSRSVVDTAVRGMMYNLSQVNINRYLEEQKIIAATQYPEYVGVPSAGLTALQGGLQGISMGLDTYLGLRKAFDGFGGGGRGSVPTGFGSANTFTSPVGMSSMPSPGGSGVVPTFAWGGGVQV
jgi:hypothetical protein